MFEVPSRVVVVPAQKRPPHTARNTVIEAAPMRVYDLPTSTRHLCSPKIASDTRSNRGFGERVAGMSGCPTFEAREFSLDLLILFGSRATGRARPDSDTDIAVRSNKVLSREEEMTLGVRLDAHFPNVEIVDIRKASPLLLGAIGSDGKLLYEARASLFSEFKIFAWNQYLDFKPSLDRQRARTRKEREDL